MTRQVCRVDEIKVLRLPQASGAFLRLLQLAISGPDGICQVEVTIATPSGVSRQVNVETVVAGGLGFAEIPFQRHGDLGLYKFNIALNGQHVEDFETTALHD